MDVMPLILPFVARMFETVWNGGAGIRFKDRLFDYFEELILDSRTTLDDRFFLPRIKRARELFGVPDLPDQYGDLLSDVQAMAQAAVGEALTRFPADDYSNRFFRLARDMVQDSQTPFDDIVLLPVLDAAAKELGGEEEEEVPG